MASITTTQLLPSSRTDKRPTDSTGKATLPTRPGIEPATSSEPPTVTCSRGIRTTNHQLPTLYTIRDSNSPPSHLRYRQSLFPISELPIPAPRFDPACRVPFPGLLRKFRFQIQIRVQFRSPIVDPVSRFLPHGGEWVSAQGSNLSFLKR